MNEELKSTIKEQVKTIFSEKISGIVESTEELTVESEEEEGDEELTEAWKVVAMGKNTKKAEDITVNNIRDLNRLAKTGMYDYFTVTKPNGEEEEYSVDERTRKLILM